VRQWLGSMFRRVFPAPWPADIPRLYPGASAREISGFLTDAQYRAILNFPIVSIFPLASNECEPRDVRLGLGLQHLLIRNLMLLRNVSVHGPEDTSDLSLETVREVFGEMRCYHALSGRVAIGKTKLVAELVHFNRMDNPRRYRVEASDPADFLMRCTETAAAALGVSVDERLRGAWRVGQPSRVESLIALGDLRLQYEREDPRLSQSAIKLWRSDPHFVVALWQADEVPALRQLLLEAFQRDPFNAQLCFQIFAELWNSREPQPFAVQYLRRAIEVSPGHGKAHMCAPHAAEPGVDMLRHSELGYRLLPGNSFAVNNYILNLLRARRPASEILRLAEEGVQVDPYDPGNYERMIELCIELGEYRRALQTAERLQQLFVPQMNERTYYCLRQNPIRAQQLESGEYNPAAENRRRIDILRRHLGMIH
jgi:hypothetical protein